MVANCTSGQLLCQVHFHSIEVARFLFARWRVGPLNSCSPRDVARAFLLRGHASGRTYNYKRIAVRVDNCCGCSVFCWLISVSFCVTFFILCAVYFVIKFIKYNDWSFPLLGRKWTPHRVERRDILFYTTNYTTLKWTSAWSITWFISDVWNEFLSRGFGLGLLGLLLRLELEADLDYDLSYWLRDWKHVHVARERQAEVRERERERGAWQGGRVAVT